MNQSDRMKQVLSLHPLTQDQQKAALLRGKDILVTAGAGSGKTRTLVARYLSLIAEGIDLREIAAITFTEKATREMRNRVRKDLILLEEKSSNEKDKIFWGQFSSQIEGSRIGTIHSLCAELIRSHPAEAGIDPQFEVLDETKNKIIQQQAIDEVIPQVISEEKYLSIFSVIDSNDFRKLLENILDKEIVVTSLQKRELLKNFIFEFIKDAIFSDEIKMDIAQINGMKEDGSLEADAKNATEFIENFLIVWKNLEESLEPQTSHEFYEKLFELRQNHLLTRKGPNTSRAKTILKSIKESYDNSVDSIIGGSKKDNGIITDLEKRAEKQSVLLDDIVRTTRESYQALKQKQSVLDFNDLEEIAFQLSKNKNIQSYWQDQISYLLVDEFQDTNKRQRDIILSLSGEGQGKLFFVGDAQQSIYRFRGAAVVKGPKTVPRISRD